MAREDYTHKKVNGKRVELTEAEIDALVARDIEEAKDFAANNYKVRREAEYPSTGEQFDKIYHDGIDEWKKVIKAVKDKYEKPE